MNQSNNLTIEEGTITFWIKENTIIFNDNNITPIFSINPEGGTIFIVKDNDNKLKVFFAVLDKGRVDLEYDVRDVNSVKKHMVALTWSLEGKTVTLYFDGRVVASKSLGFT